MRLSGKTAIVTAAGHGIGLAVAQRFRDEGARVWALDRDEAALRSIEGVEPKTIDLTDGDAISRFVSSVERVDVLANIAGFVAAGSILECDEDDWNRSFELNVTAMYRLCRGLLPRMLAQGAGSIVNMSSIASSVKGIPDRFAYGTSKAAVIGLTKSIAADFVDRGVRCNCVCPGTIDTPSLRGRIEAQAAARHVAVEQTRDAFVARQPMGRLGTASEVASLVTYLASDEAAFTTGGVHVIDGGWVN